MTRYENTVVTPCLEDMVKVEEHNGVVIDRIMDQIEMLSTIGEITEDTEDEFAEATTRNLCVVLEQHTNS